jgi:hypothetical protein
MLPFQSPDLASSDEFEYFSGGGQIQRSEIVVRFKLWVCTSRQ